LSSVVARRATPQPGDVSHPYRTTYRCPADERRRQMKEVAKVIEVVGSSEKSWKDAAENAVKAASKTVNNITGVQVVHMTGQVKNGSIKTYKATVKIAFGLEG